MLIYPGTYNISEVLSYQGFQNIKTVIKKVNWKN